MQFDGPDLVLPLVARRRRSWKCSSRAGPAGGVELSVAFNAEHLRREPRGTGSGPKTNGLFADRTAGCKPQVDAVLFGETVRLLAQ